MKKIENVSEDIKNQWGRYQRLVVAYEHEGAEVYIAQEDKSAKAQYGYNLDATVVIRKNDKLVKINISEGIGNKAGTIFGNVHVVGMPERESRLESADLGLYPYYAITEYDDDKNINGDILIHAASHLLRHDREANKKGIGAFFQKYVPDTLWGIQKELKGQKQENKQSQEDAQKLAQMKAMQDTLAHFL